MFNTISPYGSNRSNQIEGRKKNFFLKFLVIILLYDLNIYLVLGGFCVWEIEKGLFFICLELGIIFKLLTFCEKFNFLIFIQKKYKIKC